MTAGGIGPVTDKIRSPGNPKIPREATLSAPPRCMRDHQGAVSPVHFAVSGIVQHSSFVMMVSANWAAPLGRSRSRPAGRRRRESSPGSSAFSISRTASGLGYTVACRPARMPARARTTGPGRWRRRPCLLEEHLTSDRFLFVQRNSCEPCRPTTIGVSSGSTSSNVMFATAAPSIPVHMPGSSSDIDAMPASSKIRFGNQFFVPEPFRCDRKQEVHAGLYQGLFISVLMSGRGGRPAHPVRVSTTGHPHTPFGNKIIIVILLKCKPRCSDTPLWETRPSTSKPILHGDRHNPRKDGDDTRERRVEMIRVDLCNVACIIGSLSCSCRHLCSLRSRSGDDYTVTWNRPTAGLLPGGGIRNHR